MLNKILKSSILRDISKFKEWCQEGDSNPRPPAYEESFKIDNIVFMEILALTNNANTH